MTSFSILKTAFFHKFLSKLVASISFVKTPAPIENQHYFLFTKNDNRLVNGQAMES